MSRMQFHAREKKRRECKKKKKRSEFLDTSLRETEDEKEKKGNERHTRRRVDGWVDGGLAGKKRKKRDEKERIKR